MTGKAQMSNLASGRARRSVWGSVSSSASPRSLEVMQRIIFKTVSMRRALGVPASRSWNMGQHRTPATQKPTSTLDCSSKGVNSRAGEVILDPLQLRETLVTPILGFLAQKEIYLGSLF